MDRLHRGRGWLTAADLARVAPSTVDVGSVVAFVVGFGSGRGLLVTIGCGLAVALLASADPDARLVSPGVGLTVALLGLLPEALTGHAAEIRQADVAVLLTAAHVVGAAVWSGGLGAVLVAVAPRRALLADVLPRYSRMAGAALVVVALSRVGGALVRVAPPAALVTGYGLLVLVKTGLLLAVAGLGAAARRRLVPAAAAHRGTAALLGWAGAEVAVMAAAIGVAAALARTPLPT